MLVAFRVPEAGPAKASACWCHRARVTEWKMAPHYVTHRLICTWLLFEASKSLSLSPGPQGGRGGVGHGPLRQDTQLRLQPVAGNVTACFLSSRGSRGGRWVRNPLRAVCELDWQRLSPAESQGEPPGGVQGPGPHLAPRSPAVLGRGRLPAASKLLSAQHEGVRKFRSVCPLLAEPNVEKAPLTFSQSVKEQP